MSYIKAIIEFILELIKKAYDRGKQEGSVVDSKREEEKSKQEVKKIQDSQSKVKEEEDGSISFDDFKKKTGRKPPAGIMILLVVLLLPGCCIGMRPQIVVSERIPEYSIPDRPQLQGIPGEYLKQVPPEGKEIIKSNYDKLIRYSESLETILESYNKYAKEKNKALLSLEGK